MLPFSWTVSGEPLDHYGHYEVARVRFELGAFRLCGKNLTTTPLHTLFEFDVISFCRLVDGMNDGCKKLVECLAYRPVVQFVAVVSCFLWTNFTRRRTFELYCAVSLSVCNFETIFLKSWKIMVITVKLVLS